MWVITDRFAHCLRCTKLFSTILNGRVYPSLTSQFWTLTNLATSITITSVSWRRYTETERHPYRRTKTATFSRFDKVPGKVIRCPACCFTQFFNIHRRMKFNDGKRKKNGYIPERPRPRTASQTWDSPTTCCCSQHFEEQLRKMLCGFKKSIEKAGRWIHLDKTKILINQSTINSDTKATWSWWHENRNIDKKRKREIFRSENLVLPTRNDGNQEPYQGCMGDIPQIQRRVDIEKQHAQTLYTAIRRHSITQQRTRKNDSIDATQDATTHHPNKKGNTKRFRNKILGPKKKLKKLTSKKCVAFDDESGDGQITTTHNDVDSEVSFEDDADDEIDTTLIEEEYWIEYVKRSTDDATEKMECVKIRCWNRTHKNEMERGIANRNITEWKMAETGCWMEPRIEIKI